MLLFPADVDTEPRGLVIGETNCRYRQRRSLYLRFRVHERIQYSELAIIFKTLGKLTAILQCSLSSQSLVARFYRGKHFLYRWQQCVRGFSFSPLAFHVRSAEVVDAVDKQRCGMAAFELPSWALTQAVDLVLCSSSK